MARTKKMSSTGHRQPEFLLSLDNQLENENARNQGLTNRPSDHLTTQGATATTLTNTSLSSTTIDGERLADPQTQSIFFKLPVEVRDMIYGFVLSTKTESHSTYSRVIILEKHFFCNPWQPRRKHDYHCRESFHFTQLSILGTCHEIRREAMRLFWPTTVLRFDGIQTLLRFVGILGLNRSPDKDLAQRNIAVLRKAQKIECNVAGKILWDFYSLEEVAEQLERPLDLKMIDCTINEGDGPSQSQLEAGKFWHSYMMKLETKILAKQWFMTFKDDRHSTLESEPSGRLDSLLPDFLL